MAAAILCVCGGGGGGIARLCKSVCVWACVCVRLREQVSSDLSFDGALKPLVPQVLWSPEKMAAPLGIKTASRPPLVLFRGVILFMVILF